MLIVDDEASVERDAASVSSSVGSALTPREQIVKSPPEPTRVKSPEQILMRSPDPVNWTVPLDTGKTFTVTQNVREGKTILFLIILIILYHVTQGTFFRSETLISMIIILSLTKLFLKLTSPFQLCIFFWIISFLFEDGACKTKILIT